jgi:purine-nucleoside phosphorylase
MRLVGANTLVVTNAVGSINPQYQVGDIMLVCDHINMFGLAGNSPLRGPNDESFGPRFFALNGLYDSRLRQLARQAAQEVGIEETLREGVLTITGGPNYESVAELKMFAGLGVDCVGMSSIPESLVAHHCGMKVLAFSLVTNQCHLDPVLHSSAAPNHQEVLDAADAKKGDLKKFVSKFVENLYNEQQIELQANGNGIKSNGTPGASNGSTGNGSTSNGHTNNGTPTSNGSSNCKPGSINNGSLLNNGAVAS